MKKTIIATLFLLLSLLTAAGQNKKLENNILLGGGLFLESGTDAEGENPGAVLRLSYGLDIRLNNKWSVMPGAGVRSQQSDIRHVGWIGGDTDNMSMADVFVSARYHFELEGTHMVIGLGPALSFMLDRDTYYIDADPSDPRNGKEKFLRTDLGIQPSITFLHGKHFQWGFEGSVGLLNVMRQYPEYNMTGTVHLHYLAVTCGWRF